MQEDLPRRGRTDGAQLQREADGLDVHQDTPVVAHLDQHRNDGANQRDRPGAEHAVAILGALLAELADQHLVQRVGTARGDEQVEGQQVNPLPLRAATPRRSDEGMFITVDGDIRYAEIEVSPGLERPEDLSAVHNKQLR